jgi:hypothetical protein
VLKISEKEGVKKVENEKNFFPQKIHCKNVEKNKNSKSKIKTVFIKLSLRCFLIKFRL